MERDFSTENYSALVVRVARMLNQASQGLVLLESVVQDEQLAASIDPARANALRTWLKQLELCDHDGKILDLKGFRLFVSQVQGAMWALADSENRTPKLQLVLTEPDWINRSKIRHTEAVFRDLILSATQTVWIVNPFFSADSSQVASLIDLVAARLQQNITIRLLLRKATPGGREFVLPILRKLCSLVPASQLSRLKAYSFDSNERMVRQTFHSKVIVRDEFEAYIGSANWTDSGLSNAVEIGVLVEGVIIQQQLMPLLRLLAAQSEPILLETL
ncbi:phospholipase D-like domain-containing protein [Leptolyngbya sp. AN03gr2]|uniref:phospholipase D-like domain-containing protein n=1 Tax=unclassified Leptolyngbya TaxID=2650499 RepID=UPI003D30FB6B